MVHQGADITLVMENVALKNGSNTSFDLVIHPDASAVVPLTNDNHIVLIRQYRHSIREYIWEIPSGTSKSGEDPILCARRELEEETGYLAHSWHPLGHITPLPEFADVNVHVFLARHLAPSAQHLDDDEILDVHLFELKTVQSMINHGSIRDGKTICGYFMAMQWLQTHG